MKPTFEQNWDYYKLLKELGNEYELEAKKHLDICKQLKIGYEVSEFENIYNRKNCYFYYKTVNENINKNNNVNVDNIKQNNNDNFCEPGNNNRIGMCFLYLFDI